VGGDNRKVGRKGKGERTGPGRHASFDVQELGLELPVVRSGMERGDTRKPKAATIYYER